MGRPKLKLGIVGCGDIAGYIASLSRLVPQLSLSACCDLDLERAQAFARRHRIPQAFTDYSEMLAKARLEAIYLAVPHHLHYEMTLAAVEAGMPALVEKPLTRTLEEGLKLVEAVAGEKVGVNYQYRYDSGCYALTRAIRAGALGKVASIHINVPWHRTQAYFEAAAWHKTIAQAGGGTLITQGSHFLDVALWALGENPVSAMGYAVNTGFDCEVETLAHGLVQTESGALVNIASSMTAAHERAVTIEAYGEGGIALYSNKPFPHVRFIGVSMKKERPPQRGIHALARSLAGFARWILEDRPFLIPAGSALPVLAAVDALYRSAQSGMRENITALP